MNPEIYSEWLCRQGRLVIRTSSSYWHSSGMGVYQAFPYHWLIEPSPEELRLLFLRHGALALRYSATASAAVGVESYHAVYAANDYDFENLSSWARKNVRRGLRCCTVGPISLRRYVDEGWALRVDTLARQERSLKESIEDWRRHNDSAADLEGFEVWAAQVDGKLAATLVIFPIDGWWYMVYQQCHRDYLREHVNNALSFVVTQNLVRRPGTKGIYYGMRSLDAPATVDEFKFRMGYAAKPVRERVVFHPFLSPLVNVVTHRVAKKFADFWPKNYRLAKAEGLLRICLEEKSILPNPRLSAPNSFSES